MTAPYFVDTNVLVYADGLLAAIDLHRLHELSIWDAMIVRSARASGCRVLYSEDLQHGRSFDGVQVIDPFRLE